MGGGPISYIADKNSTCHKRDCQLYIFSNLHRYVGLVNYCQSSQRTRSFHYFILNIHLRNILNSLRLKEYCSFPLKKTLYRFVFKKKKSILFSSRKSTSLISFLLILQIYAPFIPGTGSTTIIFHNFIIPKYFSILSSKRSNLHSHCMEPKT